MLEAIGTVCAAAVATIGLVYFEIIKPARERPRLRLVYRNRQPYATLSDLILGGKPPRLHTSLSRLIRLGVENKSKAPARGVRVRLLRVLNGQGVPIGSHVPHDLPWVESREMVRDVLAFREPALVELIVGVKDLPENWWFQPFDPSGSSGVGGLAGLPTTPEPPFRAYVEVAAYAENLGGRPESKTYEVKYDEAAKLGALEMRRLGLIARSMLALRQRRN
jgi:hypothetical protein